MKPLLFIIAILFFLQSCKDDVQPEPEKQYSYWKVNGQFFNSNHIKSTVGNARAGIQCLDADNWFGLTFYLPLLPNFGQFEITSNNTSQDPNLAELGFWYNGQPYGVSSNNSISLYASKINNKGSYHLNSAWFINMPADSVLIEGTFNEPS